MRAVLKKPKLQPSGVFAPDLYLLAVGMGVIKIIT
jgi:hypothetical protein